MPPKKQGASKLFRTSYRSGALKSSGMTTLPARTPKRTFADSGVLTSPETGKASKSAAGSALSQKAKSAKKR